MAAAVQRPLIDTLTLTDPHSELNAEANGQRHHTHADLNGVSTNSTSPTNSVNGHTNTHTTEPKPDALTAPIQEFPNIPLFPSNVPTAPLLRLSLSSLLNRDPNEISRFIRACEDLGFFYLDLQECELGDKLQAEADELFGVGEELFALPVEVKRGYDFSGEGSYFG